jgi:predicted dehydrogenase
MSNNKQTPINRRTFVKTAAMAGVATTLAGPRAHGANERIQVGLIGGANRGGQIAAALAKHADAELVAVCDVDATACDKWKAKADGKMATYTDYREMLASDDVDAVLVASPDHWHALHTIDACDAGKDVYCEKPLSYTIHEAGKMVEAARRNKAVVQTGMQRRSSKMFADLRERVTRGDFGHITIARAYRLSNMAPTGMGRGKPSAPPATLDWDTWIGPRPEQPYQDNIAPYKFRWWKSYSSQMTNWGVHYFDILRYILDEKAVASASTVGGRYIVDDDRTIPDTMEATFEFASGRLMLFGQYEAAGNPMMPGAEFELRGTEATVYASSRGYKVIPEKGGQFQKPEPRMEAEEVKASDGDITSLHMRNFLDCIKSREKPIADVEIGKDSVIIAHLGNISLETGDRIYWDAEKERITRPESANSYLHYDYRAPWKLA